jgi:methionyl-tRNA formyltransferase
MEISVKSVQQPRVIFLGMQGNFSIPSLQALLENKIEVCAVVLPAARGHQQAQPAIRQLAPSQRARPLLPVRDSSLHANIVQMAWEQEIPVFEVRRLRDPLALATLAAYTPDLICVACFSQYIPPAVLNIPRLGCLNVHPSLLPDNRGPVPLFWTFRRGDTETGVTIHVIDEGMDSGDILAQEKVPVPDGIDYAMLEARLAQLGGSLLAKTVWQLYEGHAVGVPQATTDSSYLPFPGDQDYLVPASSWDARHVYNFIRGVVGWGERIQLIVGDRLIEVEQASRYSLETKNDAAEKEIFCGDDGLWVRCRTGWVCIVTPTNSQ